MILVDTSVWIDHLRQGDRELMTLLNGGQVLTHRFVIGELSLGNLQNRTTFISTLQNLAHVNVATDEEVMHFIERHALHGKGIGFVDAHLLAALHLTPGTLLWTRDKRLQVESNRLGLSINQTH